MIYIRAGHCWPY